MVFTISYRASSVISSSLSKKVTNSPVAIFIASLVALAIPKFLSRYLTLILLSRAE